MNFKNAIWLFRRTISSISFNRFKEGRELRSMGGVRKSIDQSWLAKGLGLGLRLLCWGFKGDSIGRGQHSSEAFPPGQCTSPQLHPCHIPRWVSRQLLTLSYSPDLVPCEFWLFPKVWGCRYETNVINMFTQEDFHEAFQNLLER